MKTSKRIARDRERPWPFVPGDEIVPDLHAWHRLGDGRHCETWLAWCVQRWAPVAIKLPRPDRIDARTAAALTREARTVTRLVHPGIQRLLDAHWGLPFPYLVFEFVEGPSLAERLDAHGALAPGDVVRLGMQLAATLHYLHGLGIVHCDLKPPNIVLREGRPVVIDFDIARAIGEGGNGTKAPGSREYMAPEQIGGAPAAPSMDLFALGAVLYEAATDVIAFARRGRGRSSDFVQCTVTAPRPRSKAPRIPQALDDAIGALLAPDPQQRPATAMDALLRLARALPARQEGVWPRWASRLMSQAPRQEPRSEIAARR